MSATPSFSKSRKSSWPVWLAPAVALLLMAAIAGFFFWYWLGSSVASSVTISPEAVAAIKRQYTMGVARPRLPAANQGLLARLSQMFGGGATPTGPTARPAPGGATAMAPLRIAHHGSITQSRAGGPFYISAGPYALVATANGKGRPGYHYKFNVHAETVLGPDDAKLMHTAHLLTSTQIGQQDSGAPPEQIAELKAKFGSNLQTPTLLIPDQQVQQMDRLWLQFLISDPSTRQDAAIKLVDAVAAEGPRAVAANQTSLTELVASVRQMLPPSQEQAYADAMSAAFNARNATRRSTTRPGT